MAHEGVVRVCPSVVPPPSPISHHASYISTHTRARAHTHTHVDSVSLSKPPNPTPPPHQPIPPPQTPTPPLPPQPPNPGPQPGKDVCFALTCVHSTHTHDCHCADSPQADTHVLQSSSLQTMIVGSTHSHLQEFKTRRDFQALLCYDVRLFNFTFLLP